MRNLFIVLYCLTSLPLWAQVESKDSLQKTELIFNATTRQKGIYRTYEEFKYNKPSIPFEHSTERNHETITLFEEEFISYKMLFVDETRPCPKKTPIWGFCDGKNIFIARYPFFRDRNVYDKLIYVGRYVYYQSTETTYGSPMYIMAPAGSMGGGMGMAGGGGTKLVVSNYIMYIDTGIPIELTEQDFCEMIADNPNLLAEFNQQKKRLKKRSIATYFVRYWEAKK